MTCPLAAETVVSVTVHDGEPTGLQEQRTMSLLSVQSQGSIFNFQKHEWSDHGWKIETILLAPLGSPAALPDGPAGRRGTESPSQLPGSGVSGPRFWSPPWAATSDPWPASKPLALCNLRHGSELLRISVPSCVKKTVVTVPQEAVVRGR